MLRFLLLASIIVSGSCWRSCTGNNVDCTTIGFDGTVHVWLGSALHAVNDDGTAKWIFNASLAGFNPTFLAHREGPNGTIYVSGRLGATYPFPISLLALDGSDGSIRWQYMSLTNTDHGYNPDDLLVAKDGTAYLSSCQAAHGVHGCGTIVYEVIDAHGALKWTFDDIGDAGSRKNYLISPDKGILMQSRNGSATVDIHSLSLVDGSVKWTLPFPSHYSQVMTFAEDSSIFLIQDHTSDLHSSSFEKSLLRLNGEDGRILWNTSMLSLESPYRSPQHHRNQFLFLGNEEVYVNGLLGEGDVCNLGVFNFRDGVRRNLPCLDRSDAASDLIFLSKLEEKGVAEDTFVITSQHVDVTWTEASILAYSGADGSVLWSVSIDDLEYAYGSRLTLGARQGSIVFAKSGHHLYSIAARNGKETWNVTNAANAVRIDFPVVAGDGTAFISSPNELVAVATNGVAEWRYPPQVDTVVI